jgi:hypothetical protein
MLVKNNNGKDGDSSKEEGKKKRSLVWLFVSLIIFAIIIFMFLWAMVRSGLVYVPWMTDAFYEKAEASYEVEATLGTINILNNVIPKTDHWELSLSENQLSSLLVSYMGENWQIIVGEDYFELYGSLFSAVNKEDQMVYLKTIYDDGDLAVFVNNIKLPRFLSDYLVKKYFLKEDMVEEESFFDEILLEEKKIVVIGYGNIWDIAIDNIDYDQFIQTVINYFLEEK